MDNRARVCVTSFRVFSPAIRFIRWRAALEDAATTLDLLSIPHPPTFASGG